MSDEDTLRSSLRAAVPAPATNPDRISQIQQRVRHRQQSRLAAVGATVGIIALGAFLAPPLLGDDATPSHEQVAHPQDPAFVCPADLSEVRQGPMVAPPPPADEPPLPNPDRAWVCKYGPKPLTLDKPPRTTYVPGPAVEASADSLTRLTLTLAALRLKPYRHPGVMSCPAVLGPVWLLVVEHDGAREGLTVGDPACGGLQLTEGEPDQGYDSSPPGDGLLDTLKYVYDGAS